jgi:hypothetical protein
MFNDIPLPVFKVITAVLVLNVQVLWDVTQCRLVEGHRRFEESYYSHFQGLPVHEEWIGLLDPEDASKRLQLFTKEHTVASQKTRIPGNYVTCKANFIP